MVPVDTVVSSIATLEQGIDDARTTFFDDRFQQYCQDFHIPSNVAAAMQGTMDTQGIEVNLFGGNPELHPNITEIIRSLTTAGHTVHLTTTGGRFMRDPAFLQAILENPPTCLALSADDFTDAADIRSLASMSLDDLHAMWQRIPFRHGQRRKACEAIYAAKLAQQFQGFPPIIFNMVLHDGNIAHVDGMIAALSEIFPDTHINPFPAQSAFSYSEPILSAANAPYLRNFIDHIIAAQSATTESGNSDHPYVPRLHYWLMLRAVFDWANDDMAKAVEAITGKNVWQCYRAPMAGSYIQIGLGPEGEERQTVNQKPGGHLGCFWNRNTVTTTEQLWNTGSTAATVTRYIQTGKSALAAASADVCPGCAFPRLTSHILATESGMDPQLVPHYLARRQEALGF